MPQEDIARYRGKYMVGWDKLREARHKRQIEMGLVDPKWPLTPRPPDVPDWNTLSDADKDRFDNIMAIYAAMIDRLDRSVGTLVDGLKERGVLDNTVIMLMCDNGGNAESGPRGRLEGDEPGGPKSTVYLGQCWATLANTPFWRYKHFTHEGGISTPLIVHWPAGIAAERNGKLEPQPGHLVDIMPTVVELTRREVSDRISTATRSNRWKARASCPRSPASRSTASSRSTSTTKATAPSATASGSS